MFRKMPLKRIPLLLCVLLCCVALLILPTINAAAAPNPGGSLIVADIAEASIPKVVWISATFEVQPKLFFFGRAKDPTLAQGLGTGFFFDDQGRILTNAHVVAGAQTIEVILNNQKKPLPAKLIGLDRDLDLAIIQIDLGKKSPFLPLGDSDQARVGESVIAIGNPYGLDHTVTQGIISAKGRPINATDGSGDFQNYENMIQTDAAINPGNSGGPLLNLRGEVIGINAAVNAAGQGLGFAIPINAVKEVLDELIKKGKISRPWLGVQMIDLKVLDSKTRAYLGVTATTDGVVIKPLANSPADKAGLRSYDVITEIDHQPVTNGDDLLKYIRKQKVGATVSVLVLRDHNPIAVSVTLGEKPETSNK